MILKLLKCNYIFSLTNLWKLILPLATNRGLKQTARQAYHPDRDFCPALRLSPYMLCVRATHATKSCRSEKA